MVKLIILCLCFLHVVCNLIWKCSSHAAEDKRQVYIVYMGALSEGDYSPYHSDKLQEQHINMLEKVVDGSFLRHSLVRSYTRSFNGFAAHLTNQEQQKLASFDEVISIFPSRTLQLQTTRSWDYIGLHENINGNSRSASDIIIGVLDSGIWPESESFNDKGLGPIPKKWKGVCNGGRNFTCNKKLIGARFYTNFDSARDPIGHGTHTASIAAGNYVKDASFYGIAQGTVRGGVPLARIAAYEVCGSGCSDADILAAFDDAIADGVDIITISVGSFIPIDVKYDSVAIGALHAVQNGILTVQSAGNSGFIAGTVASVAPWILTVAASSMDRGIVTKVTLGNGKTIIGKSVNSFKMNGTEFPLVYGEDVTSSCSESSARLCSSGCLDRKLVRGKIVLCDESMGIGEALKAGALGTITKWWNAPDVSFIVPLPASAFVTTDLGLVRNYINSTKAAKAVISTSESIKNRDAPLVASFSSKGPNPIIPDILKPDITAPGVEILAAFSPIAPVSNYPSDKRSAKYKILSGTSMSCPHAAGAAAYVKSAHPDWSPSAVKSALMTTAWPMDPTKHKTAEFAYGAGHINPVNATNPGLVYETSNEDYSRVLCSIGYSTETVEKLFKDNNINCSKFNATIWDLNYPSMTVHVKKDGPFSANFSRTVTNVGISNSTYTAKITTTSGLNVTLEPDTLSFTQLNEKKSFVVTVKWNQLKWMMSASLLWSDGAHFVRSPIVVY
ncbi:Cucumisin [Handroanthus impetiginosus]|uniref:Cucumisin n=1 Tax=Handroanthus impetiginosus TaxID=429701 RepID=A0A2G9I6E3_9LAMI|nr:Cucumisin [Handroanthus impetiginosus]